jgi:hypothetical protein
MMAAIQLLKKRQMGSRCWGVYSAASEKVMSKGVKDGFPAAWAEGRSCRVEVVNTGSKGQRAYARAGKEQHSAAVDSVGDNFQVWADLASVHH